MKTHSKLYRMVRLLGYSRQKTRRIYRRYLTWATFRVGRPGRKIPHTEVRDMGLAVRAFNRDGQGRYE